MVYSSLRLTKVKANTGPVPDISNSYQSVRFHQVDTTASISMSVDTATEPDSTENWAGVSHGSGAEIAVSNPMFQHDTDQVL